MSRHQLSTADVMSWPRSLPNRVWDESLNIDNEHCAIFSNGVIKGERADVCSCVFRVMYDWVECELGIVAVGWCYWLGLMYFRF